ncbi:MAG: hypothetical protein WC365_06920 [Candidatus Babeliales bacterium]|jgi:ribosomal protein RSM22 (predicted rRNA methylase)
MNDPAETLRTFIEAQYTLATATVAKDDVAFQTVDYNLSRSVQSPHIIVQLSGFQRKQQAESALYDFTFLVQVSVFPKFRQTQAGIAELQALYWAIVNHIKIMIDRGIPTGWEYAYVDTGANAGIAMGTIPDEYVFNLTVKACIAWSS